MIVPDPSTFGYYGGSLTLQGSTASDAISSQPAIIAGNYLCFELCFLSTGAASYVHPSDRSLTAGNSLPTGTGGNITFRIEASITEYGAASGSEMLLDWIEIQEHSSTNADCQDCDTVDGNTNWCFCNCGPCSVVCRPPTLVVDSSDIDAGNWTNYPGPPCSGTSIPDFAPINSGVTYTGTFPSAADRHWWMCNLTQATIADDPPTWAAYIYETNLATADPNGTVALAYQLLYGPEVADNDPRAQGKLTVIALHARPSDESGGHPNFWQFGGWGPVSLSNYGSEVPGDCRHSNLFPSQSYSLEPGGGSAQDWIPGGPPRDCANPPQSWPSGWIRVNLGVVQVNCSCNSPPQIKFCANSAPPDVVAEAAPLSGGIPW